MTRALFLVRRGWSVSDGGDRFWGGRRARSKGQSGAGLLDGILQRQTQDGGRFGVDGVRHAPERAENPTAAAGDGHPARVTDCWPEPLEDDATVVVLAVA